MEEKKVFEYSYSAKQQEEIEAIKKKYLPKDDIAKREDKLEELRRLDRKVELTATIWSIVVGLIGTLVFGGGMSMVMVFDTTMFVPGILLGLVGMAGIAAALPVYRVVLKKEREKAAPEVLKLTEELES